MKDGQIDARDISENVERREQEAERDKE